MGDISLYDPGTGGELAVHDEFADLMESFAEIVPIVDRFFARRPFIASDGRWHDPVNSPFSYSKLYAETQWGPHTFFIAERWTTVSMIVDNV